MPRLFGAGDGPRALCQANTLSTELQPQPKGLLCGFAGTCRQRSGVDTGCHLLCSTFFFFLRQLSPRAWSSPFSGRPWSPEILLSLPPQQYWGMHSRIRLGPRAVLSPFSLLVPLGHSQGPCRDADFRSHGGASPGFIQVSSAPSAYLHTQVTILGLQ